MSKAAHTNLPWALQENTDIYTNIIRSQTGLIVCYTPQSNSLYNKANADLIVTAANHHQELVTRLENLVAEFSKSEWEIWCDHSVGICACAAIRILDEARETLKKVKQ
jgi:hypothetical protein